MLISCVKGGGVWDGAGWLSLLLILALKSGGLLVDKKTTNELILPFLLHNCLASHFVACRPSPKGRTARDRDGFPLVTRYYCSLS